MKFPVLESVTSGNAGGTGSLSHNIDLPAVVESGDYLIAAIAGGYGSAGLMTVTWDHATAGQWTQLFNAENAANSMHFAVFYKRADGSEKSKTLTVSYGSTTIPAWAVFRVSGAIEVSLESSDEGAVSNPDFPQNKTPLSAGGTLWLALLGLDNPGGAISVSAYSDSYRDTGFENSSNTRNGSLGWAFRSSRSVAETPGPWTLSAADESITATVAISSSAKRRWAATVRELPKLAKIEVQS